MDSFDYTDAIYGAVFIAIMIAVLCWWCAIVRKRRRQLTNSGTVYLISGETNTQYTEHPAQPYTIATPPPYQGYSQYRRHYYSQSAPPPPYSVAVTQHTETPVYSSHEHRFPT